MAVQPALDADTWDIQLDATGDLLLVRDGEEIAQHVRQRLNFFEGEWPWNLTIGIPWFGEILGPRRATTQTSNRIYVESILKAEILETPGVTRLLTFDFVFDDLARSATFNFRVDTAFGDAGTDFFDLSVAN